MYALGFNEVVLGHQTDHHAQAPTCQHKAAHSACTCQKYAFDHQLPDQPQTAGAQRSTDGHLALPCCATSEQHAGHVRADDQQYKSHCPQERENGRTQDVFRHGAFEGTDRSAPSSVRLRKLRGQAT